MIVFFLLDYIWAYTLTNILQLDVAPFFCLGTSKYDPNQAKCARNCIGEVIRLFSPHRQEVLLDVYAISFFCCCKFCIMLHKFFAPEVFF